MNKRLIKKMIKKGQSFNGDISKVIDSFTWSEQFKNGLKGKVR